MKIQKISFVKWLKMKSKQHNGPGKKAWTIRRFIENLLRTRQFIWTIKNIDDLETIIHARDIIGLMEFSSNMVEFQGVLQHQLGIVRPNKTFYFLPGGEKAYNNIILLAGLKK